LNQLAIHAIVCHILGKIKNLLVTISFEFGKRKLTFRFRVANLNVISEKKTIMNAAITQKYVCLRNLINSILSNDFAFIFSYLKFFDKF